ncbi:MAG TPA: VOC family protein [Alphaproteobacteria bacterium]|jgi:2,3-dihydroxybiphenyl 1,2-dioxygenase|nr:VOC family protein [Alphaproteobacteria bacterium]
MLVQALAYLVVRTDDRDDWASYGTRHLGLQKVDGARKSLAFRMDDRKQRVIVDAGGGKGIAAFGWEVADASALDTLAARLETAGIAVERGSRSLAAERRVRDLIVTADPLGNRIEIAHGCETATDPFVPGRNIAGFRTGPLGLGHVVLNVERADAALAFYRDTLGFGLSDYYYHPFEAYFFHVNPRHHSFAMVATGKSAVHHVMMELYSFDDVGHGLDIAQTEEGRLAVTLGRHFGDFMTSFYTWTPSGFMMEYGWGGRAIDPATWQPFERKEGPSIWGHERSWLPPEGRAAALKMRLDNAANGLRRPVQVIEGNYTLMPGTCPWWDEQKRAGAR